MSWPTRCAAPAWPRSTHSTRRRAEYSTDASNYRVVPQAVVFPRDVDEIIAAVAVAREAGCRSPRRGGGTSTAGNSVGPGLVLDFSRHLNRVLSVDPDARTAVVEPGAVLDDITAAAAGYGLRFGPDPSTHARATIGGAIGNNACGSRALRYGRTADNVVDARRPDRGRQPVHRAPAGAAWPRPARRCGLDRLVADNLATIRTEFGRFTRQVSRLLDGAPAARERRRPGQVPGRHRRHPRRLPWAPPSAWSRRHRPSPWPCSGTRTCRRRPTPCRAVLPHRPVALEGMDARLVDVVRRRRGPAAVPTCPVARAGCSSRPRARPRPRRGAAAKLIADAGCPGRRRSSPGPAPRALWRIREDGAGLGGRTPAGARPGRAGRTPPSRPSIWAPTCASSMP